MLYYGASLDFARFCFAWCPIIQTQCDHTKMNLRLQDISKTREDSGGQEGNLMWQLTLPFKAHNACRSAVWLIQALM